MPVTAFTNSLHTLARRALPLLVVAGLLGGCAISKPRTDDPWESFNRKMYKVNSTLDKAVVRPVAVGYRKVTNPPVRNGISNIYDTLHQPAEMANELLQGKPLYAVESLGRMVVNLLLGFAGMNDLASTLGIPNHRTDFGVTLARWGVPEGNFLMMPLFGPTTVRDIWRFPVDGVLFDPMSYLARNHHFHYGQYYIPGILYFVVLREQYLDADSYLKAAYDPYVFMRDAYRQSRLNMIYYGNPPADALNTLQGLDQKGFDPDQLLQQQQQWEQQHGSAGGPSSSGTKPAAADKP